MEASSSTDFIGRIYKITSNETDKVYIGSTTQTLNKRLSTHKGDYKCYLNNNNLANVTSFEIVKYDDAKIELLIEKTFSSKEEMRRLEGCYIQKEDNVVNKLIAGRTEQERGVVYREENQEKLKETNKKYYESHKEIIAEKTKEYRDNHKQEIADRNKNYRETHK